MVDVIWLKLTSVVVDIDCSRHVVCIGQHYTLCYLHKNSVTYGMTKVAMTQAKVSYLTDLSTHD